MEPQTTPPAASQRRLFRRRRIAGVVAGGLLLAAAGGGVWALTNAGAGDTLQQTNSDTAANQQNAPAQTDAAAPTPEIAAPAETLRVIAMGDMLAHDSVNANAQQADGTYDFAQFFAGINEQLQAADVTFCNQEVLSLGASYGISGYPVFNAPIELSAALAGPVGCDLVNLANNHSADKGVDALREQREQWEQYAPAVAHGTNRDAEEQQKVAYFEREGVKFALVSFAEYSNSAIDGVSLNMLHDTALIEKLLTEARQQADIVIVSAHWGQENVHQSNAAQQNYAQIFAAHGADVVIGTGPHVLQEVEWLPRPDGGKTLVWYSIGNMLSTQLKLEERTGVIAGFEVTKGANGYEVQKPDAILTYMHYDWSATDEAAGALAARHNLAIVPLADSQELLNRTRFGVDAKAHQAASAAILGDAVTIKDR